MLPRLLDILLVVPLIIENKEKNNNNNNWNMKELCTYGERSFRFFIFWSESSESEK